MPARSSTEEMCRVVSTSSKLSSGWAWRQCRVETTWSQCRSMPSATRRAHDLSSFIGRTPTVAYICRLPIYHRHLQAHPPGGGILSEEQQIGRGANAEVVFR